MKQIRNNRTKLGTNANRAFQSHGSTHIRALEHFKATFRGGSEKKLVAKQIDQHFDKQVLSLLDVGTGDGSFLSKIIALLSIRRISVDVTGVDPSSADATKFEELLPGAAYMCERFEDYAANRLFDVVLAVHSLYYLDDQESSLQKMVSLLRENGMLVLVLWSRECDLWRLRRDLWGEALAATTAEDALRMIRSLDSVSRTSISFFEGSVDFGSWKDPRVLSDGLQVISRDIPYPYGKHRLMETSISYLSGYPEMGRRVNGIVTAVRNAGRFP